MSSELSWYGTNPNQGRIANYVSFRALDKENPQIVDGSHERMACSECTIPKVRSTQRQLFLVFHHYDYSQLSSFFGDCVQNPF